MASLIGPNAIIQSTFVSNGPHGNLEAVLWIDGRIQHWYGVPGNLGMVWSPGQVLPPPATGAASMIQSDFGSGPHGNFEVVLLNGSELWHWWHDNSDVTLPWQTGQRILNTATGPGSIIQSTFKSGQHGNFEVVVPEATGLWHWWHDNSNVALPWQRGGLVSAAATGAGCIIQSDFGSGDQGNFEVVVLEGHELWHHWHDNSDVNSPWQRGQRISPNASGPGAIIQGQLGSEPHYNFEVVVPEGNDLVHYWHDNGDVNSPWQRGQVVSVASTGAASLVRSDYGPGGPGNFEVLVHELTKSVVHYWHHNVDPTLPWWRGPRIVLEDTIDSPDLSSMVKVSQLTGDFDRQLNQPTLSLTGKLYGVVGTDLGSSFQHAGRTYFLFGDTVTDQGIRQDPASNLDTVAYTTDEAPVNGIRIVCNPSYPRLDGNINQSTFCVPCDGVSFSPPPPGPAWIIQSNLGNGPHHSFEVVVLEGSNLVHWRHDNSDVRNAWRRAQVISTAATGPGCIIQSTLGSPGNFEVVVLEGSTLQHYWHDNSDLESPWQKGGIVSSNATGPGCLIQSTLGSPGNFEVVVLEATELWHHWHDNSNVNSAWQRGGRVTTGATGPGCLIQSNLGSPGNFEVVVPEGNQLWHHWHDNANISSAWQRGGLVTSDATGPGCLIQSNFGSPGNFEVVVLQGGSIWHHWHDNADVNSAWQPGGRVAANATGPGCFIQGNFGSTDHGNFEAVVPVGAVLQHFYHDNSAVTLPWAPAEIITNPSMYVFFTTNPVYDPGNSNVVTMGNSLLARSDDNGNYFGLPLFVMSRGKFINLSLQLVENADLPGLPQRSGQGVLIWGTGGYRRSNAYLGYVPFALIEDRSAYVFFAGLSPATGLPNWVADESQATSLFLSGCMGELCVRWNPFLRLFVMLFNADNQGYIVKRQSPRPWGPWSDAENIFNYNGAWGAGGYMHQPGLSPPDGLSDPNTDDRGSPYGPYVIDRYTRADPPANFNPDAAASTTMYFVLSTHNPYNTMLMAATFRGPNPNTEGTPFRPGPGPVAPKFPLPHPPTSPFRPGTGPVGLKFPLPGP